VGLGLLILGAAYYVWSSDVANVSRLKTGKGIEIRATSGNINIVGRQDNDVRVTIENVSAESAMTAHIKIDRNRNPILIEIKDHPQIGRTSSDVARSLGRTSTQTVMKLGRIICIAGRLANRGDSNAQILTFALRDRYQYAVIGPINIR
jgi:predicted secreted protein